MKYAFVVVALSLLALGTQGGFAQNGIDDVLTSPGEPIIKGPLTPSELGGQAALVAGNSLVFVEFVNNGKRTLSLNGDAAQILTGAAKVPALEQTQIIAAPPKIYVGTDVLSVLTSLGTVGSGPVVLDAVHKHHSIEGLYYGKDQDRRSLASRRFGPRVIFPGEISKGILYLPKSVKLPAQFTIPVASYPDGAALGNVVLNMVQVNDAGAIDKDFAQALGLKAVNSKVVNSKTLDSKTVDVQNSQRRDQRKKE
jgi:hypothetical protein